MAYCQCHTTTTLPMKPHHWWHVFIGPNADEDLSIVCNSLLALQDKNCVHGYKEAMTLFVTSLIDDDSGGGGGGGGSFNDPGSYIWNAID